MSTKDIVTIVVSADCSEDQYSKSCCTLDCLLVLADRSWDLYSKSCRAIECLVMLADCSWDWYFSVLCQTWYDLREGSIMWIWVVTPPCTKKQHILWFAWSAIVQLYEVTITSPVMRLWWRLWRLWWWWWWWWWCGWYDGNNRELGKMEMQHPLEMWFQQQRDTG